MTQAERECFDAVGVGIGPSNLSLAALIHPLKEVQARFFDREEEFQWHPGLLFPEATIQVSFIKDLVTLADPTNPCSFLSFLSNTKRLYRFINANFAKVSRREFNQYFRWVCASLSNLEFGREVKAISIGASSGNSFLVDIGNREVETKNIVLGTGLSPRFPDCARPYLGPTVCHASQYLGKSSNLAGKRVAVIGGGQSSAELVFHWLSNPNGLPREIHWISRRANFLPLDDSPFINEFFTPAYSDYFFGLAVDKKSRLVKEQKLASDGIAKDLLEKIYRRLYELEFLEGKGKFYHLHPGLELRGMTPVADAWLLNVVDGQDEENKKLVVDAIVLCTGYHYSIPECLKPLASRISWDAQGFSLRKNFSIEWDGPESLRIYVQNAARRSRGVADPNLSLMAWRSASIVNSLADRCVYDLEEANSVFDWTNGNACV